jgi:glycosyltransferase involved in cell wall biosynthesis
VACWAYHERVTRADADVVVAAYPECVVASKLARPFRPVLYRVISISGVAGDKASSITRQQIVLERVAAKLADAVLVESDLVRQQALRFLRVPERKMKVVPLGMDYARFATAKPCAVLELLRSQGCFLVLCVGRLHAEKDLAFAIDALGMMENRPRTRLVFVGEGPEEPALRRKVADAGLRGHVVFVGKVADPESYMAGADVLALPSRYETFGSVLVEAMAAGLPCVGRRSDFPRVRVACPEIIRDGVTGFCADPHDPCDMARRLDQLSEDPELRKRLGESGRRRAREEYSRELMADRYLRLLTELVRRRRAGRRSAVQRPVLSTPLDA